MLIKSRSRILQASPHFQVYRVEDEFDGEVIGHLVYNPLRGLVVVGFSSFHGDPEKAWEAAEFLRHQLMAMAPAPFASTTLVVNDDLAQDSMSDFLPPQNVALSTSHYEERVANALWGLRGEAYDRLPQLLNAHFLRLGTS